MMITESPVSEACEALKPVITKVRENNWITWLSIDPVCSAVSRFSFAGGTMWMGAALNTITSPSYLYVSHTQRSQRKIPWNLLLDQKRSRLSCNESCFSLNTDDVTSSQCSRSDQRNVFQFLAAFLQEAKHQTQVFMLHYLIVDETSPEETTFVSYFLLLIWIVGAAPAHTLSHTPTNRLDCLKTTLITLSFCCGQAVAEAASAF